MGTRGYRVVKYWGRYYIFFNQRDSYPTGLGEQLVNSIPTDPEAYKEWLAISREHAHQHYEAVEQYLCRKRADYEDGSDPELDHNASDDAQSTDSDDERPWGIDTDGLPNFMPGFNHVCIEWVYTIDLDREVFSVDNGAHFRLGKIPQTWISALDLDKHHARILNPTGLPEEAIADLVEKPPSPAPSLLEMYDNLHVTRVQAKDICSIQQSQRLGPLLRTKIFRLFQKVYEETLSATLLSWRADGLPFREMVYAILCLVSASCKFCLVPSQEVIQKGRFGYADLQNIQDRTKKPEFLAHLGIGCYLEDLPPGSSPDSLLYWFDGVLVYLVAQLIDYSDSVHAAIAYLVKQCQAQRSGHQVNAIITSIEHIVLLRIYPGGRVERTDTLPLFHITNHTSLPPRELEQTERKCSEEQADRDEEEGVCKEEETSVEKEVFDNDAETLDANEGVENEAGSSNEKEEESQNREDQANLDTSDCSTTRIEDTETTFINLINLLESSWREQMSCSAVKEGVFPTEIYRGILLCIADLKTHRACMQVSQTFRTICQQNVMLMDDVIFQATDGFKTYDQTNTSFPVLMKTISTGYCQEVTFMPGGFDPWGGAIGDHWGVVIGDERHRRSLIPELLLAFDPISSSDKN